VSDERLAEIEQRCAAATPGPWEVRWGYYVHVPGDPFSLATVVSCQTVPADRREEHEANARLIAHAREDVPALLAEVRRLRAVGRELRGQVRALVARVESLADRSVEGRG
jgi:hypothetical protein